MKVVMPSIGMAMQDGKIIKWYQDDGAKVTEGEPMVDIESEKLTNTIPAPATGVFKRVAVEGDVILCGDAIAEITEG